MGCDFHIEIYAPDGLSGIEPYLSECQLPLEPYVSGFNGQVILRYTGTDDTDFAMDPSTSRLSGRNQVGIRGRSRSASRRRVVHRRASHPDSH